MTQIKSLKYSIEPIVMEQYTALGRVGANALNELNQCLINAKKVLTTDEAFLYEHEKSKLRIYVSRNFNVITRVEKAVEPIKLIMDPTITDDYEMCEHAIERAWERFNIPADKALAHFNNLLKTAIWHSDSGSGRLYDHNKSRTRIVVDPKCKRILTVYRLESELSRSKITIDRISAAIKRELSKMTTQLRREIRKLTEQQAQLNVTIAELTLNKIRCKAPHTQALIQTRIDAIITQVDEIAQEVDAKLTQIKNAEREVSEVVGE